jgi:hypothetical protein
MSVSFETLLTLPRVRVGAVGRVVLSAFEGLGDMDGVVRVQRAVLGYARRTRGTVGSLVLVTDGRGAVKGGDDAQRSAFLEVLRETEKSIAATAVVVASEGFGGAALRAFVSGVSLVARTPYPLKVFSAFGDGRDWLVDRVADAPDRAGVCAELDRGLKAWTVAG